MSRVVKFFRGIAESPTQAIEVIVAAALFVTGLWLVSPFYTPRTSTSTRISDSFAFAMTIGVIELCLAIPFIAALLFRHRWPMGIRVRRWVTFICFLLFTFYATAGAMLGGLHRITWVSSAGYALIAGVLHLRLKWEVINSA